MMRERWRQQKVWKTDELTSCTNNNLFSTLFCRQQCNTLRHSQSTSFFERGRRSYFRKTCISLLLLGILFLVIMPLLESLLLFFKGYIFPHTNLSAVQDDASFPNKLPPQFGENPFIVQNKIFTFSKSPSIFQISFIFSEISPPHAPLQSMLNTQIDTSLNTFRVV